MPARTVTLPDHVGWRFAGNMNASAMALGDADNDGGAELVVANIRGCLAVFKYLTGNGDMGPGTAGGGRDDDRPSRRSSGSRYSPVTRGEPGSDNDEGLYGNAGLDNDSTDDESDDSDSDSDADSVLDDWTSPLHGSTGAGYNMGDPWLTIDGLGTVTSLAVGDILGTGRNSIVAVSAEGTLHVLDIVAGHPLPADLGTPNRGTAGRDTAALVVLIRTSAPLNVCRMLIADVDGDGRNELILARTDRQVYIFSLSVSFGLQLSPASIHIPPLPGASGAPSTPFTSRPGSIAHGGGSALPGGGGGPAHSLYQEALRSPANTTAGSMHLAMSSAAPSVSSLSVGQQAAPTPPATATGVGAASAASGLQASSGLAAKLGTLQRRRTVTSPPSNLAAVIASGPSGTGGDHHGLASHVGSIAASAAATATSNSTTGAATTADAPGHASVSASTPDLSPTSTPMPPQILPAHSLDLRARHGFPGQVASLALIERSEGARFLLVSQPCGTYVSLSNDGQQSTVTVLPQRAGLDLPGPKENALGMNSYLRNLNAAMSFQRTRRNGGNHFSKPIYWRGRDRDCRDPAPPP
ncbi:hypothetical protein BC828DRAFT_138527 [Blastocladiella britannica]|nr:hypothetical protein BC828DRAFT_138527 [Blastocladiella britannica]